MQFVLIFLFLRLFTRLWRVALTEVDIEELAIRQAIFFPSSHPQTH